MRQTVRRSNSLKNSGKQVDRCKLDKFIQAESYNDAPITQSPVIQAIASISWTKARNKRRWCSKLNGIRKAYSFVSSPWSCNSWRDVDRVVLPAVTAFAREALWMLDATNSCPSHRASVCPNNPVAIPQAPKHLSVDLRSGYSVASIYLVVGLEADCCPSLRCLAMVSMVEIPLCLLQLPPGLPRPRYCCPGNRLSRHLWTVRIFDYCRPFLYKVIFFYYYTD